MRCIYPPTQNTMSLIARILALLTPERKPETPCLVIDKEQMEADLKQVIAVVGDDNGVTNSDWISIKAHIVSKYGKNVAERLESKFVKRDDGKGLRHLPYSVNVNQLLQELMEVE